jgi:uncharacterized protein (TIGR03083 family)
MATESAEVAATTLSELWRDWASRIPAIRDEQWETPTRCEGWNVRALVAHVVPDPDLLAWLPSTVLDQRPAVADAIDLLRGFNQRGGVAHTMAPMVAAAAIANSRLLTPARLARRFSTSAQVAAAATMEPDEVVPHPVAGTVTVSVLTEVSIVEGTIHLLDLIDAIGGPPPPLGSIAYTSAMFLRMAEPIRFLEVAAGRADPSSIFPLVR